MKYFRSGQYPIEFILSENINKEFSSHNHANHYIISLCIKGSVSATLIPVIFEISFTVLTSSALLYLIMPS